MTNTKTTKRALFTSFIALLLCVSMLVGTTFAWFTDSVTSANNIIKSGNLDVELYYQVEGQSDWTKVTAETNVFMESALWEPGHTEVVKLKIVNEGSLALKYTLGVNIAGETASVNVYGDPFLLSDYIKFGIVDGAQTYTREQAVAAVDATATALKTAYNSNVAELLPGTGSDSEDIVTMVVYMPTTVGNEANHAAGAAVPTINLGLNLFATQLTYEKDSFDDQYDKNAIIVTNAAEAQAALDNATVGTTIKLAPGVNYGTLYLRPTNNTAVTKEIDWQGNNYVWETYSLFENITILGAAGAVVDAIEIEGLTTYNNNNAHSQGSTHPTMLSLVELKNVVIDGVTFTGNGGQYGDAHGNAVSLAGNNIKVDGLTLKNCVLKDSTNNNRLLYKSESTTQVHTYTYGGETFTFSPSLKNITVTGCTFDGGYMGLELRETENVTITNNIFNVADRNILLTTNSGCTYTGTITVAGNVSNNAKERFVRASGTGDAIVVIKNNTLNAYMGDDADYIKVTDGNNVTIENNTLASIGAKDAAAAQAALDNAVAGTTIQLQPGVNYGTLYLRPYAGGAATKDVDWIGNNYGWETYTCFENLTIIGASGATVDAIEIEGGTYYHTAHSQSATYPVMLSLVELKNVVIDGVTFTGNGGYDPQGYGNAINLTGNIKVDGLTLKNCVLENEGNNARLLYKTEGTTRIHSYTYGGETLTFTPSLKDITVTGCTLDGGYMGLELRETENVTITNNIFNVADRNILLPVNTGCSYTGTVTITGNVSNNAKERFVRADGMGNAVVIITGNTLNNYQSADADYIKVTNANNVTIENNTKN